MNEPAAQKRIRRASAWKLVVVVGGMFGFGFALVPMYNAVCQLVNLNGKDEALLKPTSVSERIDENRLVKLEFLTTVNGGRVFDFRAEQPSIMVHPGKLYTVKFYARNRMDVPVTGQAVPSIAPGNAARHLHKTECFCFNRQTFAANEEKDMPVRFMLDPDLPAGIETMSLSYTFFDVTALAQRDGESPNPDSTAVPKS